MKNIKYFNKVNFIYPLEILHNSCIFYKTKCVFIKYLKKNNDLNIFFNSIKLISVLYYSIIKERKSLRYSTVRTKNKLSFSTRKIRQQKGLGKARLGSLKSPSTRGGFTLFGPKNTKLIKYLKKKNLKLNFFYLILNKRTHISFLAFVPLYHVFNSFFHYITQYQRIKGLFSCKVLYILKNVPETKQKTPGYFFNSIHKITLYDFLNSDFIVFLI